MARCVCCMALMLVSSGAISAQVNKSNLTGVVRDSSGAAVVGAAVKLTNTGTGATRQEITDATGLYRFTLVDHGFYRIDVEHSGFKKFVRENIQLQTGKTITVDTTLELGQLTESATVTRTFGTWPALYFACGITPQEATAGPRCCCWAAKRLYCLWWADPFRAERLSSYVVWA